MRLYEVQDRNQPLLDELLDIWEQSVRATHLFLSDAEELMRQAERLQYYGAFREYDALHRLDCAELEDFGVYAFP